MKTHGNSWPPTKEYRAWSAMKQRCQNPNHKAYSIWGGRGIKVCSHWQQFENFLEDMGRAPKGMTLERIDNSGNYELRNCIWTSRLKQAHNRRDVKLTEQDVERIRRLVLEGYTNIQIAKMFGVGQPHISRISRGKRWPKGEVLQSQ